MKYRIIVTAISVILLSAYLGYRDSRDNTYFTVKGVLENIEFKAEVVKAGKIYTEQHNLYIWLSDRKMPYVYREFEERLAKRYMPYMGIGQSVCLVVNKATMLVTGITVNGAIVLDHVFRVQDILWGYTWLAIFGLVLLIVGFFYTAIVNVFKIGT